MQIRLVCLVVLLMLTDGYDVQAIGYAAPAIAEDWGVNRVLFGPVFSAGLLGLACGALLLAPVADRIGSRRVLIGCALWYAALTIGTAFVQGVPALTAMRFLTGLGLGGAMPNAIALVSDYAPGRRRTLMITLAVCGFSLGGAFGGLIAALVMDDFGWRAVFLLGGVAPLLLAPCLALWLPESPRRLLSSPRLGGRLSAMTAAVVPGWSPPAATAQDGSAVERLPVVGLFARGYAVPTLLIWGAFFMNLVLLYLLSNWLPLVMRGAGFSLSLSSLAIAFYQGGGSVGALALAFLCDRRRPQAVLAAAFVGAALFLLLLGSVKAEPRLLMAIITGSGFFVIGGQSAANAFAGSFYPSAVRATGVGWALGVGRMGSIVGPLLGGALLASGASMSVLFQFCAIPAVIAALAILLVRRPEGG
jgi:AAHS family 4-hydroxybenzoate transporter-like MFS transporter